MNCVKCGCRVNNDMKCSVCRHDHSGVSSTTDTSVKDADMKVGTAGGKLYGLMYLTMFLLVVAFFGIVVIFLGGKANDSLSDRLIAVQLILIVIADFALCVYVMRMQRWAAILHILLTSIFLFVCLIRSLEYLMMPFTVEGYKGVIGVVLVFLYALATALVFTEEWEYIE